MDIEANTCTKVINCVQIILSDEPDKVFITSGDNAVAQAHDFLARSAEKAAVAMVWDKNMESKIYPYCYDLQRHPSLVDPKSGKMGLHKAMLHSFGDCMTNWQWVQEVKSDIYNAYSHIMEEKMMMYGAYDVASLALIYDKAAIIYEETTDVGRVKIGDFTFDKTIFSQIGNPIECQTDGKVRLQQLSLKQLVNIISNYFG